MAQSTVKITKSPQTCTSTAHILERMLRGAGLNRDTQLAAYLGISPQAVSQARRKAKIPEAWILRFADRAQLSVDWLLSDISPEHSPGVPAVSATESGSVAGRKSAIPAAGQKKPQQVARELSVVQARPRVAPRADIFEAEEPAIDLVLVPQLAARLAAGQGSLETDAQILDYHAFRQDWLCRKGNPDAMVMMKVSGDSMEPEIQNGDLVLIDQGKNQIYGHAIYAVGVNEEIYIKQIETLPGHTMRLLSLNTRYAPIEVDLRGDLAESVHIIGRVIWWCREA